MSGEEYLLSLFSKKSVVNYSDNTFINQRDCPFVKYSKDRVSVKYVGKGLLYSDISSIQSNKPANRDTLVYYYEVKILNIGSRGDICIGLAGSSFPPNKYPGSTRKYERNCKSYGYKADGKVYTEKQPGALNMPKFNTDSIIGCGINYIKREVFFTFNGEYFGPAFKDIELREFYATVSLHSLNENISFNFGSKPFMFDIEKMILEEKREGIKSILNQPVNHYSLHQLVHSYLNFHGYASTLEAFEKSAQIERKDVGLPRKEVFLDKEENKDSDPFKDEEDEEKNSPKLKGMKEMDIEIKKEKADEKEEQRDNNKIISERFRSDSFRYDFESPGLVPFNREHSFDLEPFMLNPDGANTNFNLFRKASIMVDLGNANSVHVNGITNTESHPAIEKKEKNLNDYLLAFRAEVRQLIEAGKLSEAIEVVEKKFPGFFEESKPAAKSIYVQQFIEHVRAADVISAIQYSQKFLTKFQNEKIFSLDSKGILVETPIDTVLALLCYPDPANSELKHYLDNSHREMTADIVNGEILSKVGFIEKSILDVLVGHLTQMEDRFKEYNSLYGEGFEFKV